MVDFWYRSVNKLTLLFGWRAAKLCHCFLWSTVSASSWYSLPSGSHCVYIDTAILFAVSLVTSWSSNSAKYSSGQSIVHDVKIMQSVQVICCPRSCPVWSMQSKIMLCKRSVEYGWHHTEHTKACSGARGLGPCRTIPEFG